jgi:uncharacterized protein YggT (Ycf19 family)
MREVHDHPVEQERVVERDTRPTVNRETRVDRTEYVEPTVQHTEVIDHDPYAGQRGAAYKTMHAVHLIFGVIVGLVGIRFILKALGANQNADFAAFIYNITDPLVAPFAGLFGTPRVDAVVIELHSLVAIVVYALSGWLLGRLVWLLLGETRTGRVRSTIHER